MILTENLWMICFPLSVVDLAETQEALYMMKNFAFKHVNMYMRMHTREDNQI